MGKCSKTEGMIFGEDGNLGDGGKISKKCKPHKCHTKMNLCRKSHPNRTIGKCSKNRGSGFKRRGVIRGMGEGGKFREKNEILTISSQK